MSTADVILLRCAGKATQEQYKAAQALAAGAGASGVRGYGNAGETYIYFDFSSPREVADDAVRALEGRVSAALGGMKADGVALRQVQDIQGVSAGFPAPVHYVVEMDFTPAGAEALTRWYEQEHLPGLSSVSGSVRSRRYMSASGRSFACYDLNSDRVPESPEWMKWRETEWTRRVREHHLNMKRGIFLAL